MRRLLPATVAVVALAGCGGATRSARPTATPTAVPRATQHHARARFRLGPHPLRGRAARQAAVPILLYHVLAPAPPGTPFPELWTAPARFAAEMRALASAGYRAVTLERVLAAWHTGAPLPRKPLVVSFDDGYASQYKAAYPVLRRLGWPGVLNLAWNNLGPKGIHPREVRALLRAGWELDSHTVTHPDLTTLAPDALRHELVASKALIRRRFGPATARLFCYPLGRYDATVEAAVRAAGYAAATSTRRGVATAASDRFALPRIRVDGTEAPAAVLLAVGGS